MSYLLDSPLLVFATSVIILVFSTRLGVFVYKKASPPENVDFDDFGTILAATLTLLGLIIGFAFSMAVSRYDQRKNLEEEEANAIGTEYLRAELSPPSDAAHVRELLKAYLQQRILYYQVRSPSRLAQINGVTSELQSEMWSAVEHVALSRPDPTIALEVSGMNDVLNSQGYAQAAWRNRIPLAAWLLIWLIAICCNILIGYRTGRPGTQKRWALILPLILAISLALIADIDSPRGGLIRVKPVNLQSLADSL